MDSQSIARFVLLFFIVCLAVYFLTTENKQIWEKFENIVIDPSSKLPEDKDKLIQLIKDIYASTFPEDPDMKVPSQKGLDFYIDFTSQRTMTVGDLQEIIRVGATTLEKSLNSDKLVNQEALDQTYGTEDEVVEIYKEILLRNPDDAELAGFAKLLKTDSTFNLEKLKQILYASEEYKRLEKTQTNAVYSNLIGGVTDRQLTLIVTNTYTDITGQTDLDADTMRFLKRKLLSFNIDQAKFKDFLTKYLKNEPFTKVVDGEQKVTPSQNDDGNVTKKDMEQWKDQVLQEVKASIQNTPKVSGESYTTQSGNSIQQVNPNRQVIEILLRTAKDDSSDTYLDSQKVMDTIKNEAKCVFDKNASDSAYQYKNSQQQSLAELQDNRNTEELKNTCIRNKNYLGVDEDMVLDKSLKWSVPQRHPPVCVGGKNEYEPRIDQTALIGTLLEQAVNTQIGSVLPETPPR